MGNKNHNPILGLKRRTVKLVPYNPKWKEIFQKEKQLLKKTFKDKIIAVEHIGSTAIPGLPAKPILDINVGVISLEIARDMKEKFEEIGYEYRPFVRGKTEKGLKKQELYVKGPEARRTHYVHVTIFGSDYWKNDLLFRDYLHENSVCARTYSKLKNELAKRYANNRREYTKEKNVFINETVKLAKKSLRKRKKI